MAHEKKGVGLSPVFRTAAFILKELEQKKGSVKNLIYTNARKKKVNVRLLYALVYETLKHIKDFKKVLQKLPKLEEELGVRKELLYVILFEFFFGKKSLPVDFLNMLEKHRDRIEKLLAQKSSVDSNLFWQPRYVRVNTLLTTIKKVKQTLKTSGFKEIPLKSGPSFEDFLSLIKGLGKNQYIQDYHFDDMLVLCHGVNLSENPLYLKGHLILTDKASLIPVHALKPEPGSSVLDACAAPGIKTSHIAAMMKNNGTLYAIDKNWVRYKELTKFLSSTGVTNCKVFHQDFTAIDPLKSPYKSIEYILLDPSCSGSGIVARLDFLTDDQDSKNEERIKKLSGFQIKMLKHACKFPNVRKIVYCTCSMSAQENEYVIQEVLNSCEGSFSVKPIFEAWPERGSKDYKFGADCIRCFPEKHYTNGFFVALLERNSLQKKSKKKTKKHSNESFDSEISHLENTEVTEEVEIVKSNKKKRKRSMNPENLDESLVKSKKLKIDFTEEAARENIMFKKGLTKDCNGKKNVSG